MFVKRKTVRNSVLNYAYYMHNDIITISIVQSHAIYFNF